HVEPVAENVVYELVTEEQPQQVIQQEVQEPQGVLEQQQDPAQGPVDPNTEQQPEEPVAENVVYELVTEEQPQQVIQ
ncbi:unnamed protein product, partial [Urochloa humidicola]